MTLDSPSDASPRAIAWMWVIWPSFLMACILEMLIFAVISPAELTVAHEPLNWSARTIYSVSFFVFWVTTFCSSLITARLTSGKS